jgi:hypothetical protein
MISITYQTAQEHQALSSCPQEKVASAIIRAAMVPTGATLFSTDSHIIVNSNLVPLPVDTSYSSNPHDETRQAER